jgi:DNA (cytosine-5)-methyltransferase 1
MKVGSLFTGYGGLDLAVGGDLAWYAEIEPAACQVLEAHHPGVPNLGDITQIDWSTVPPVDIITGGYPCQPFSTAGHRKGANDERHLWPFVWDAIRTLGPRYAILENVRGHLSLGFADVLADLASIGWDAEWAVVPASAVGACHRRERIFILAYSADTPGAEWRTAQHEYLREASESATESGERAGVVADTLDERHDRSGTSEPKSKPQSRWADAQGSSAFAPDNNYPLISTPTAGLGMGGGKRSHRFDAKSTSRRSANPAELVDDLANVIGWGQYEPAIRRWEHILGRPAPDPTIMGGTGRPRLNPVFVEWMMGLPEGWVTGHGLSAAKCLKMLGNGVVPQQANYAITQLFARIQ